jgi:recombination protein RecT
MTDSNVSTIVRTLAAREMQEVIRKTLPANVSQESFTQAAVAALKRNPQVFEKCDRASIYNAIVDAARDGLMPDGRQGALVAYGNVCKFLIMPDGIIDKLAKLGITAYAASVYEGEKIRIWNDDRGQHIEHEPSTFGARGARIGAYAVGHVRSTGATYIEAVNTDDLRSIRAASRSKDKNGNVVGAWNDWPDRMEQKSALHRLERRLPNVRSTDDYEDDEPRAGVTIDVPPPEPPKGNGRPAALQRVVDQAAEEPPPHTEADAPQ